ncbi:hypothetical protein [Streptomyces sp. NPDC012510]|uniref:hypothetical protein n=1 Tax=Streptomyces sp. NPDC012510 TaxID=3364838 RepID=UPI0036E5C152
MLGAHARVAVRERQATVHELPFALLTVTSVLALAQRGPASPGPSLELRTAVTTAEASSAR